MSLELDARYRLVKGDLFANLAKQSKEVRMLQSAAGQATSGITFLGQRVLVS